MAAITALTAQNTRGVSAVHVPPAAFLTAQLEAISQDITIDAVKIGMLGDASVIDAVRSWLEKARPGVVVLDPVMVATSGDRLLQEAAEAALHALLPFADLITPNLAELAVLLREPAAGDWAGALDQGKRLAARTGTTVLVKGGHLDGGAGAPMRWSTPAGCWPRTSWWCRGSGCHPQQPRHRVFAVLGDRHRAGEPAGGLGGGACARSSPGCRRRCASRRRSTSEPATARSTTSTTSSSTPRTRPADVPAEGRVRRRAPAGRGGRRPGRDLRPGLHRGPGRRVAAGEGICLLPRPGRPVPQRLFPGAGPRRRDRTHRGRAAVLGPLGAELPRSRVGAAPDLAEHPDRGLTDWGRSPSPTWTTCWPPRFPAATGCWWPPCSRASGSMPRWGRPCTGSSSPPERRRPSLRRLAAHLRGRGVRRRHPAGRRVHRRRGTGGLGGRAGRHDAGLPAVRPLRGRVLRRAAAARLTPESRGEACTIGGHGSGSRCGSLSIQSGAYHVLPPEPASFAAEGKISVV